MSDRKHIDKVFNVINESDNRISSVKTETDSHCTLLGSQFCLEFSSFIIFESMNYYCCFLNIVHLLLDSLK